MKFSLIPSSLRTIAEKVERNERISDRDALTLYEANDLNALGILASVVRERKNGNIATYILNRYINYSNICVLSLPVLRIRGQEARSACFRTFD